MSEPFEAAVAQYISMGDLKGFLIINKNDKKIYSTAINNSFETENVL